MQRHLAMLCGIKVPYTNDVLPKEVEQIALLGIGLARGESASRSKHIYTLEYPPSIAMFKKNSHLDMFNIDLT